MTSDYIVMNMTASYCTVCKQRVRLLTHKDGTGPSFFLCPCGRISQVGVGPVREDSSPGEAAS
jgi:hypothetical protein